MSSDGDSPLEDSQERGFVFAILKIVPKPPREDEVEVAIATLLAARR